MKRAGPGSWRRRGARRRGFTLTELMVYLGLVSVGLATFASIEEGARRSVALQGALIDCEQASRAYLDALRTDVERARAVRVQSDALEVSLPDGARVVYRLGERREVDAHGRERGVLTSPLAEAARFARAGREVRVELTLRARFGWRDDLTRTYRRVATPRVSGAPVEGP